MTRCPSLYRLSNGELLQCLRPADHKDDRDIRVGQHVCTFPGGGAAWRTEEEAGVIQPTREAVA